MIRTPHDALFKHTFSDPQHAAVELRAVLPLALTRQMDLDHLRVESGSYVDEALSERHSDLLYSVPFGARRALVYVLFEHQSTVDALMPFRMLRYLVRIWDGWLRDHPEGTRLPLILPLVLYHGAQGWTAPLALQDLIDLEPAHLAEAQPFIPHFRLLLDDLSALSDDELRLRSASALVPLVLYLLKNARHDPQLVEHLHGWAQAFNAVWSAPNGWKTFEALIRYILQVSSTATAEKVEVMMEASVGAGAREVVMTVAEQLMEKGERRLLMRLLQRRFGPLPTEVLARVERADETMLERWADEILFAESLDALLAEPD